METRGAPAWSNVTEKPWTRSHRASHQSGLCHCATSGTKPRKNCPLELHMNGPGDPTFVRSGLRGSVANVYFKVKCRALPGAGALLGAGSSTGNKARGERPRLSLPPMSSAEGPGRVQPATPGLSVHPQQGHGEDHISEGHSNRLKGELRADKYVSKSHSTGHSG